MLDLACTEQKRGGRLVRVKAEGAAMDRLTREVHVAAVLTLAFAVLLVVLALVAPSSQAQQTAADPLIQLFGPTGVWPVVGGAIVAAASWRRGGRISRRDLAWAAAGAVAAAVLTLALRGVVGSELPSFIPSEESGRPGITRGLAAGLVEEIVFRLGVLPGILFVAARRLDRRLAAVVAVVVTATVFSLSHELGPAGGVFDGRLMLTRFLIPGVGMSIVALRVNVTFIVFAHCTAHLLIPGLFPG